MLEINPEERWARVEPGCVLDDLNRALKPHGLLFAADISTSNRATIGGMIANNSSVHGSVFYGKTIDHVLELKVVLVRRQPRAPGAARRSRRSRPGARGRTSKARATARHAGWPPSTPGRSIAASPRSSGASAVTTSTSSFPGGRPGGGHPASTSPGCFVGSEGTLGHDGRGQAEARRAAARPGDAGRRVRRPARSPGGDAADPAASSGGGRGRGQVRARQHPAQSRGDPAPRLPPRAIPPRSC